MQKTKPARRKLLRRRSGEEVANHDNGERKSTPAAHRKVGERVWREGEGENSGHGEVAGGNYLDRTRCNAGRKPMQEGPRCWC